MTEKEAEIAADELKALVYKRTGLTPQQLVCPREKSDMTPCLARDGRLVVVMAHAPGGAIAICVGCERPLQRLLDEERAKAR